MKGKRTMSETETSLEIYTSIAMDREEGKRKKKNEPSYLIDDLVFEILSKLPAKKLFQYMCVSKIWYSIIKEPAFIKEYPCRNPNLLVFPIIQDGRVTGLHCSPIGDRQEVQSVDLVSFSGEKNGCGITDIIDGGVFCFYSFDPSKSSFFANLFTHEIMALPQLPFFPDVDLYVPDYYLGFDPVDRVYKLFCKLGYEGFRKVMVYTGILKIMVLTIGKDSCWREVAVHLPQYHFYSDFIPWSSVHIGKSICVDGSLYWISRSDGDEYSKLFSFNLHEEMFHEFSIPISMHEHRVLESTPLLKLKGCLVKLKGRLCLCDYMEEHIIFCVFLKEKNKWKINRVPLPVNHNDEIPILIGNMSDGKLLFMFNRFSRNGNMISSSYVYTKKKNKFEKVEVGKLPQSIIDYWRRYYMPNNRVLRVACVEQNIAPLNWLI